MSRRRLAVVLGAGVAGLAAAWRLAQTGQWDVTVIEQAPTVGGVCATFQHDDLQLDYGPHKCFSVVPEVLDTLRTLMGAELLEHEKRSQIYLFGQYLQYPLRLPQLLRAMGWSQALTCAASAAAAGLRPAPSCPQSESYEQYLTTRFGRHLYHAVFKPLAEKVWGDPSTLSADLARTRLSSASFFDVLARLVRLKPTTASTDAATFYYPRRGFGRIPARMAEETHRAGGVVRTSTVPVAIHHTEAAMTGVTVESPAGRETLPCEVLISTIPLDRLGSLLQGSGDTPALDALVQAAARLQYRHLLLVYVVVECEALTTAHWIFFPDRARVFGRVSEQKQFSPAMIPPGRTVLCCDLADDERGPRWTASDEALGARCVEDLRAVGLLGAQRVRETFVKRVRRFYPRYDLAYRETLSELYRCLRQYTNLVTCGRIGFYNYNNSDHCLDMALWIERGLSAGADGPEIMAQLEARVTQYRIVD